MNAPNHCLVGRVDHFDKIELKKTARGQWKQILTGVCGVAIELLDGNHHPCPKCGGNDRFRMIDEADGALMCNQCFTTKNGDGIAAIMWLLDCDFKTAMSKIGDYLGLKPVSKARKNDPSKHLKFVEWNDLLAAGWCLKKKPIQPESLKLAGAKMAIYRGQHKVIAIPVWRNEPRNVVGWSLYNITGGTLPRFKSKGVYEQVKVKLTYGSEAGLIGFIDPDASVTYKTEGPSDLLALISANPADSSCICNANGAKENPRNRFGWLPDAISHTKELRVVHDCDQPGQEGATMVGDRPGWAPWLAAEMPNTIVKNLVLPYPIERNSGKDIRDWLVEGSSLEDLEKLAKGSSRIEATRTEVDSAIASGVEIPEGTRVIAGDRGNVGTVVTDHGSICSVRFVGEDGTAVKELPKSELKLLDGTPLSAAQYDPVEFIGLSTFVKSNPSLRDPIIGKLLRAGETANIIAATKVGKSWLASDLAIAVATGSDWLKEFETAEGAVVYIDNELHPETLASRFREIAEVREVDVQNLEERLFPVCLRGTGHDINSLEAVFDQMEINPQLIVLDAWYRFIPAGTSENDNAEMMAMYNTLDRYAKKLDCAFVVVHHASKGDQSGKAVTDVGSGAGAMSRAADTHVVIRPHEDDSLSVINAATRSFPPLEPLTLFFTWPCWHRSTTEPKVRSRKSASEARKKNNDQQADKEIFEEFRRDKLPFTAGDVKSRLGMNKERATRILKSSTRFETAGFREPTQARYAKQELFRIKCASGSKPARGETEDVTTDVTDLSLL